MNLGPWIPTLLLVAVISLVPGLLVGGACLGVVVTWWIWTKLKRRPPELAEPTAPHQLRVIKGGRK